VGADEYRPAYDPSVPSWRLGSLLLAAAVAAGLTSCDSGGALGEVRHTPNAADAAFLRSITEHEESTLGITRLAQHRALRAELRGIARTMTSEQHADLRELGSLAKALRIHGVRRSTASGVLARVKDAPSFDYEFMRTMIEQIQRAIAIAHHEVSFGSDPQVKRLAAAIESSRKKELERIRTWLHTWYGGDIQPSPPSLQPPGGGGNQTPSPAPRPPQRKPPVPL